MTKEEGTKLRGIAWIPGAGALLAFLACNGILALAALLSLFGLTLVINPHLQADVVSFFALLTLALTLAGYRKRRVIGALDLATVGAALIVWSMYLSFTKAAESLGLLALISAAIWNWRSTTA